MAPEQALGEPSEVDARSDVYSLGAVMYEMLAGRPPVDGPNALAVIRRLSDEAPTPLRDVNPDVPEGAAAICHKAMARDKRDRFATAGEFADAVQAYLLDQVRGQPATASLPKLPAPPRTPRRRWPVALALLAAVCVAAAAVAYAVLARPPAAPPAGPSPPDLSRLVAQARETLGGPLQVPETATPRDRLHDVIGDLSAVLTVAPDHAEARRLRGRAYRWAGEHQAAAGDLTFQLQKDPADRDARVERLLALYQLHILYLGNFEEPLLRPPEWDDVKEDVEALRRDGGPAERRAADEVEALAKQQYAAAAELTEKPWPESESVRLPDWAMLDADALYHAAGEAFAVEQSSEGEAHDKARQDREGFAKRADKALRKGLDRDPYHVGLLFLKANGLLRRGEWDAADEPDDKARDAAQRKNKAMFETASNRLRRATLRVGGDTCLARAVLLHNAGRDDSAVEQLTDALSCRPTPPFVHTFLAYARLQAPPDGLLTPEEAEHILRDLQPAFENPPDDFNSYFVRALALTAAGRWDEARHDLHECRRRLGKDDLPTSVPAYADWFRKAVRPAPGIAYLQATLDVTAGLAVPVDLRVKLGEELLRRLNDDGVVGAEGIDADDAKKRKGDTHLYLARAVADAPDGKPTVLRHLRAALALGLPDLTPDTLKMDDTFKAWNDDEEFVKMYAEFAKPAAPGP
jgi:tetratricopeptide (TPR) repeat protein